MSSVHSRRSSALCALAVFPCSSCRFTRLGTARRLGQSTFGKQSKSGQAIAQLAKGKKHQRRPSGAASRGSPPGATSQARSSRSWPDRRIHRLRDVSAARRARPGERSQRQRRPRGVLVDGGAINTDRAVAVQLLWDTSARRRTPHTQRGPSTRASNTATSSVSLSVQSRLRPRRRCRRRADAACRRRRRRRHRRRRPPTPMPTPRADAHADPGAVAGADAGSEWAPGGRCVARRRRRD